MGQRVQLHRLTNNNDYLLYHHQYGYGSRIKEIINNFEAFKLDNTFILPYGDNNNGYLIIDDINKKYAFLFGYEDLKSFSRKYDAYHRLFEKDTISFEEYQKIALTLAIENPMNFEQYVNVVKDLDFLENKDRFDFNIDYLKDYKLMNVEEVRNFLINQQQKLEPDNKSYDAVYNGSYIEKIKNKYDLKNLKNMNYEDAREFLKKYVCVEDWQTKFDQDGNVYCLDMTIKGHGWVRIYSSCNGNINTDKNIEVLTVNKSSIDEVLKPIEQDLYCKNIFIMLKQKNENIKQDLYIDNLGNELFNENNEPNLELKPNFTFNDENISLTFSKKELWGKTIVYSFYVEKSAVKEFIENKSQKSNNNQSISAKDLDQAVNNNNAEMETNSQTKGGQR